jgi:lauroyl/myristoyl acyltransferase
VFWRNCVDWIVGHVPEALVPSLVFLAAFIFFFVAGEARRTVRRHLQVIYPKSSGLRNWLRTFSVFHNFGWSLTDAAVYRQKRGEFEYAVEGEDRLAQLREIRGAIVLTAHMGNYDLGSAVFVEKLHRSIKTVRAPEPDARAEAHLRRGLEESAPHGIQILYNTGETLAFDLLGALRAGEIVSIQGDRPMGDVAQSAAQMFGQTALLPSGPIVLALTAEVPIFPAFVLRSGYRKYRFVFLEPFKCERGASSRAADIAAGMQRWAETLEGVIRENWAQWYAFTAVFQPKR